MERLAIYSIFLYIMAKCILNAIEQEKWWWLAVSLVITTIGAILYYYSR